MKKILLLSVFCFFMFSAFAQEKETLKEAMLAVVYKKMELSKNGVSEKVYTELKGRWATLMNNLFDKRKDINPLQEKNLLKDFTLFVEASSAMVFFQNHDSQFEYLESGFKEEIDDYLTNGKIEYSKEDLDKITAHQNAFIKELSFALYAEFHKSESIYVESELLSRMINSYFQNSRVGVITSETGNPDEIQEILTENIKISKNEIINIVFADIVGTLNESKISVINTLGNVFFGGARIELNKDYIANYSITKEDIQKIVELLKTGNSIAFSRSFYVDYLSCKMGTSDKKMAYLKQEVTEKLQKKELIEVKDFIGFK